MPSYTAAEQAAIDYINTLNNNAYNPSTNTGGLDNNGHRVNFILSLTENLKLIDAALRFANVAEASSSELTATSSSPVTIGTGTKNFTIETGKAFAKGQTIKIVDNAAPTTNIMIGSIISYDSGTGALSVDVTSTQGSGTISDWVISIQTGINNVVEDSTPQLGGDLDCNGKTIDKSSVRQIADASLGTGTHTFDYANGDMQQLTATGNITIAFSNFPTGNVAGFVVDAVNWGAHTITHPAGIQFAGGTAPNYTASGTDRLVVINDKDDVLTLHVVGQDIKA